MRRNLLTIVLVAVLAGLGPARADDDRDEDGRRRGRVGIPPWVVRDRDWEDYERLEEQRRDAAERFEERLREAEEERLEAEREYYEDIHKANRRFGEGPRYPAPGPVAPAYGPGYPPETNYEVYPPADPMLVPSGAVRHVEPPLPPVGGTILAMEADALIEQSGAFIQVFSQTGAKVPEAGRQLAEAQALNESARYFRQLVSAGAGPRQLADVFRAIEKSWGRMSRRTERLARGRTGPNIEQVRLMGRTIDRMSQAFSC